MAGVLGVRLDGLALALVAVLVGADIGRKPMALLDLVYRDRLFPRRSYALAFEALLARERAARVPYHGRAARPCA